MAYSRLKPSIPGIGSGSAVIPLRITALDQFFDPRGHFPDTESVDESMDGIENDDSVLWRSGFWDSEPPPLNCPRYQSIRGRDDVGWDGLKIRLFTFRQKLIPCSVSEITVKLS